jgi:hypothetical protein
MKHGPEIGQRVPLFEALDQHGRAQSLQTVRGPNGAFIVFHRSADW